MSKINKYNANFIRSRGLNMPLVSDYRFVHDQVIKFITSYISDNHTLGELTENLTKCPECGCSENELPNSYKNLFIKEKRR